MEHNWGIIGKNLKHCSSSIIGNFKSIIGSGLVAVVGIIIRCGFSINAHQKQT